MYNVKKIAFALGLFIGLTVFSFGDTFYSFAIGYYRLGDQFPKEDFGRSQNGATFTFTFYYFPDTPLPLGFFARTSFGTLGSGYEWKGDDKLKSLSDSITRTDVRFCFAPSYKFQLGSKVHVPISLGPAFGFYREKTNDYFFTYEDNSFYYEALNLGIMADAALIFIPASRFFLKQGFSVEWDFLHVEKGEMKMTYRESRNSRFKGTPYLALGISVYFGIGLRFE